MYPCTVGARALAVILLATSLHNCVGQLADIIDPPKNSAGRVGESLNFTCQVSGETGSGQNAFEWLEYQSDPAGFRIFSDPSFGEINAKYAIFGRFDLNIKSMVWRDGGRFACRLFSQANSEGATLFVFEESQLLATRMVEGEVQTLECTSRFGAPKAIADTPSSIPTMTIMVNGVTLSGVKTVFTDSTDSDPFRIRGTVNYTARAQDNDQNFTCVMSVPDPAGYTSQDSVLLDIQFPVKTPVFAPKNPYYVVDEHINCTAEGSPAPQYNWQALQSPAGEISQTGSTLMITEAMITDPDVPGDVNRWRCTATNMVGVGSEVMESSAEIEFTVVPRSVSGEAGGGNPEAWKIGVGVGVPLAIIVIVAAIVAGILLAKKRKEDKRAAASANKMPPPEIGSVNKGAAFPGDADLANGNKPAKSPISPLPNPLPEDIPANRSRDSPGYADLGVKQISNSYPGVNVSMSSVDSFDDSHHTPPAAHQRGRSPSHVNASYQPSTPPQARSQRPNYLNVGNEPVRPNHPDTFV